MFFGEYQYKIDEKGRVPIPPKFRRELREGVILAPGVEECITVYSPAAWKTLAGRMTSGVVAASKLRRLKRALFATAFSLKLDGQGRVALPAMLREHAGVTDSVVIAGANDYLEIWSLERWEAEKTISREQAWQIIESLERYE